MFDFDIPSEDGPFPSKNSYRELETDVQHKIRSALHADGEQIAIVHFGPNASFIKYSFTSSSGKK